MIPLFTASQNREADSYAINELAIPSIALMENASRSIFQSIITTFDFLDKLNPIGFIVGKGNNGGDALATARHFVNDGFIVKILMFSDGKNLKGDAATNFEILEKLISKTKAGRIKIYNSIKDVNFLSDCSVIVDGLLGTGAKGILTNPYDKIIEKVNLLNSLKVAIDIPSGIDADTGFSDVAFEADLTISLGDYKQGLFIENGKSNSGKVEKGYIGIGQEYFNNLETATYVLEPEDVYNSLPTRKENLHKYSAGKVFTIAGSEKYIGAGIFSASSPFYVGAGASILAVPKAIRNLYNDENIGLIFHQYGKNNICLEYENLDELSEKISWADVVTIGPGLGREETTQKAVLELIKKTNDKFVVLDADGIFPLNKIYKKYNLKNFILTPHQQEFANLINVEISELKKDVLTYGRKFAQETESYLVLKGSPTIMFFPNGEVFVNPVGNSGMAKFGMGDVLSGIIAGFLSQTKNIEKALFASVYIHSLSADLLSNEKSEFGFTAKDVMLNLPTTIKFLNESIL